MAQYIVQIPKNWERGFGGNSEVTVNASNAHEAKVELLKRNVPWNLIETPELAGTTVAANLPPNLATLTFDPMSEEAFQASTGFNERLSEVDATGLRVVIPQQYRRFTGGQPVIDFTGDRSAVVKKLVRLGIPAALARTFFSGATPENRPRGASFSGDDLILRQDRLEGIDDPRLDRFKTEDGVTGGFPAIGGGDDRDLTDDEVERIRGAETEAGEIQPSARFSPGTFTFGGQQVGPAPMAGMRPDGGASLDEVDGGFGGASIAGGLFRPDDINPEGTWVPGQSVGGFGVGGFADDPTRRFNFSNIQGIGGEALRGLGGAEGLGGNLININELLGSIPDDELFYTVATELGEEQVLNPLVEQLLLIADSQGGRISEQQIAEAQIYGAVQVAQFEKDAAIRAAEIRGDSEEDVARIIAAADQNIATTQATSQEAIASLETEAQQAIATTQAGAQTAAAQAAAGAASPFGFMQQGGTSEQLANIYSNLNQVGLAEAAAAESQAQAARLGAQGNIFSFAAGQEQFDPNQLAQIAANSPEAFAARAQVDAATAQADAQRDIARIQSSVGLDQNQKDYLIAQVNSDAQRAVAAIQSAAQQAVAASQAAGQIGAARAGASGFGALLSGDTTVNDQANAILRAQQANNPYAVAQLGDVEQSRIDQILRGGLTAEQRLAEIRANQEAQNFANQLNFISSPSAVGFASERGLLQDISNSPEGNIPGSLFGFNAPSAAGAGGGQTTNVGNYNLNTLRNVSDEQLGFLQGAAAAEGMTPSEFEAQAQAFTPQGV